MMEKNHGHIVSLASIGGLIGAYQLTDYCSSKFAAVGFEESLRLELNCDGYDGIHSTVVCPYYIATGMFAGISRSLIPILTPEYVVKETVKAVLVNQEILCLPTIVYFLVAMKPILPTLTFIWLHRAIGAASTMKSFTGRQGGGPNSNHLANNKQQVAGQQPLINPKSGEQQQHISVQMNPPEIGITIANPQPTSQPLTQ